MRAMRKPHGIPFSAALGLALALAGCSDDPPASSPDAGKVDAGPCPQGCSCDTVCDGATDSCVPRQCGKSTVEDCADEQELDCGPDETCENGRCHAPTCEGDSGCEPLADGHPRVCSAGRCIKGCDATNVCPDVDGKRQRCDGVNEEVTGGPSVCRTCECALDYECEALHPEGIWACFSDTSAPRRGEEADCRCHEVPCRRGRSDCQDGFTCEATTLTCVPTGCPLGDADCVDEHKYCRTDIDKCVCCDGVSTGECPDDCCQNTAQCRGWFGATYMCDRGHRCIEQPCDTDSDCDTLGTACNEATNLCAPISCARDTDCPRRTDIRPLPTGIFWCGPEGECVPGCRQDSDCPDNRQCAEDHTCQRRMCQGAADCELGRWCRHDSPDLPEDAEEGDGICEEGCDEPADCPPSQPCRLDVHGCGCLADDHCTIVDANHVCGDDGVCIPPCRAHDDCLADEACIGGHCIEGACRNDTFEVSSVECPTNDNSTCAFELPLEDDAEDPTRELGSFDARICSGQPVRPGLPVDLSDWYMVQLGQYDELTIEVIWPLVDTDDDGVGDAPGACDLQAANLSVKLWRGRGAGQALEWPAPGWQLDPPDVNQPCRLTATTKVAAPQAQAYYLSIENLALSSADYRLLVTHRRTVACEDDEWEPNNDWDHSAGLFDCGDFIATGGFLGQAEVIGGPMLCREDKDVYELHLRDGDQLVVTGRYDPRLGELRALLYYPIDVVGPDAMFPFREAVGEDGTFTLIEDGAQTVVEGDYLLEITAPTAFRTNPHVPTETAYTLDIACEGPRAPCIRDPFEDNDRPAQAHCIDPAGCDEACGRDRYVFEFPRPGEGDAQLHLCEDGVAADGRDEDWYRVEVNPGSAIAVLAENDLGEAGNWNIEVEIVAVDGNRWDVLGRAADPGSINEVSVFDLDAGTYYVRVLHPINAPERTVPYRLRITVHCTPPECNEDNYEENDVLAQAPELPIEPAPPGDAEFVCYPRNDAHLALCRPGLGEPEERDYFKVDLRDVLADRMEVEVRCVDGEAGDLNVEVRKAVDHEDDGRLACPANIPPDGECRDIRPGDCAADPARVILHSPSEEFHYLKVFGFNDPQNEYDLCVKVVENVCDNEDQWEENDSCNRPAEALVNHHAPRRAKICPTDEDWWWFDTPAPGFVRVRAQFIGGADIDIAVVDKTCDPEMGVLVADRTQVQMPCLILRNTPADRYYVRLWGADALSEAEYDLDVQFSPDFLPCN